VVMWQHNIWCVFCVERCAGHKHTSPNRKHTHTPNVMLDLSPAYLSTQNATHIHQMLYCHITTLTFYIFKKFLKSMTLTRNIRAPWRWSEWWSRHIGAFLCVL